MLLGDVTTPAFTACVGATAAYERGDIVDFTVELTNQGDFYDGVLDVFYCPVDGIYMFHVSLLNGDAVPFGFDLVKNNEVIMTTSGYSDHQVSNLVFVECADNELVWVQASVPGSAYGLNPALYSCFSGALLQ